MVHCFPAYEIGVGASLVTTVPFVIFALLSTVIPDSRIDSYTILHTSVLISAYNFYKYVYLPVFFVIPFS